MKALIVLPVAAIVFASPSLAQAGVFSDLLNRCVALLASGASGPQVGEGLSLGIANSPGELSFEIDPNDFDVVIYDISQQRSDFRGARDPRLILRISDDSSGASDSSNVIGFLEGSWSPNGELLLLVDTYGNLVVIRASDLKDLRDLKTSDTAAYDLASAKFVNQMIRLPSQRNPERGSDVINPRFEWIDDANFKLQMSARDQEQIYTIRVVESARYGNRLTVSPQKRQ